MYGSGSVSGSFYHQAKKVRKTLNHTVLWLLYDILSLKNYVNVASKSNKQKNIEQKMILSCHLEGHWQKYQDRHPDSLGRGTDRIRIRTKMSRIRNTAWRPTCRSHLHLQPKLQYCPLSPWEKLAPWPVCHSCNPSCFSCFPRSRRNDP